MKVGDLVRQRKTGTIMLVVSEVKNIGFRDRYINVMNRHGSIFEHTRYTLEVISERR